MFTILIVGHALSHALQVLYADVLYKFTVHFTYIFTLWNFKISLSAMLLIFYQSNRHDTHHFKPRDFYIIHYKVLTTSVGYKSSNGTVSQNIHDKPRKSKEILQCIRTKYYTRFTTGVRKRPK